MANRYLVGYSATCKEGSNGNESHSRSISAASFIGSLTTRIGSHTYFTPIPQRSSRKFLTFSSQRGPY